MVEHQFADREALKPFVGSKVWARGVVMGKTENRPHRLIIASVHIFEHDIELDHVLIKKGQDLIPDIEMARYHWVMFQAVVTSYRMPKQVRLRGKKIKVMLETYGIDEIKKIRYFDTTQFFNEPLSKFVERKCQEKEIDPQIFKTIPNDGSREYWADHLMKGEGDDMVTAQINSEQIPEVDEYGKTIPGLLARYTVNQYGDVFESKKTLTPLNRKGKLIYLLMDQDDQRQEYGAGELVARAFMKFSPSTENLKFRDGNINNARVSNLEISAAKPVGETLEGNDWDRQRRPVPYFPDGWEISRSGKLYYQNKQVDAGHVGNSHVGSGLHPALRRIGDVGGGPSAVTLKMLAGLAFCPDRFKEGTAAFGTSIPYDQLDSTKLSLQELHNSNGIRPRVRAFGNLLSGTPYQVICTNAGIVHGRRGRAIVFADGSVAIIRRTSKAVVTAALGDILQVIPGPDAKRIKDLVNTEELYKFYKGRAMGKANETEVIAKDAPQKELSWDQQRRPIPYFPDGWEVSRSGKLYYQNEQYDAGRISGGGFSIPALRNINGVNDISSSVSLAALASFAFNPERFGEATTAHRGSRNDYGYGDPSHPTLTENPNGNGVRPRVRAFGHLLSGTPYQVIYLNKNYRHHVNKKVIVFSDGSVSVLNGRARGIVTAALSKILKITPPDDAERIKEMVNTKELYEFYKNQKQPSTVAGPSTLTKPAKAAKPAVKPEPARQPATEPGLTLEKNGVKISGLTVEQVKELLGL